jgi:hypothetical protein
MRNLSPFTMIVAKNYSQSEVDNTVMDVLHDMEHELTAEINDFMEAVS